ncbi:MAG: DUF58 domain-containing protein [Acidimicrobiia bacterium]|nr:DUF58 domain-containing protein [Acidimicrobiia bacterium]NNL28124.1 DUF58 domain-containing protein [Acidimicrobiia bacterium]
MSPTPFVGFVLAASAVLAFWSPVSAAGFAVITVGLTVADAMLIRQRPDVAFVAPSILNRGQSASMEVSVDATYRCWVRQPGTSDVIVEPDSGEGSLTANVTATRRGRHRLAPLAVKVQGPMRLAKRVFEFDLDHELLVYPDLPNARNVAAAVRTGAFRTEGKRSRGALGLGTEFESIREYTPDHDIRQVNWLATARMGEPMVNQWRIEQDRDVVCVIDCGRLMASPIGQATRLDLALDVVAAIAAVTEVMGDRCGMLAFDRELLRDLSPSRRGSDAVVRASFDLEPSSTQSNYRTAFQVVASWKRAFVVVLTDIIEESAAQPLLDALPVLARRHQVVVASVSDPDLEDALAAWPQTTEDVARGLVAHDLVRAKDEVVLELTRRGARYVEAGPDGFPDAVVSAYLGAKSAARF